jgi:hypothetical protein
MFDAFQISRAVASNLLARVAPATYLRLTRQTGRGDGDHESAADVAAYFRRCVDEYIARLGLDAADAKRYFRGKVVLEYGPGDLPGVAALLVALGARKVYCVDRFPMVVTSRKNQAVFRDLVAQSEGSQHDDIRDCLKDPTHPELGFSSDKIEYLVRPHGLSGLVDEVDLVISRAVLEHVDDLHATFVDMADAMRSGAAAIHLVDLRSHGLHRHNPLDFLECPAWLWGAMFSHKGVPNRWRIDRYREIVRSLPVDVLMLEPTDCMDPQHVHEVRPRLAGPFKNISDGDLACLGFWLAFRKR